MPLFTIVTPTYNRAHLIGLMLDSVANQTFRDFEVVIADDGSTDGTEAIARRYPFVTLVKQPNAGPGAARNLGIAHATGRYVAFLDSDDLWFPWTLATYAAVIEKNQEPALVIGCPAHFHDPVELAGLVGDGLRFDAYPDFYSTVHRTCMYGTGGMVVRRDHLQEVGAFTNARVNAEDLDLLMRLGTAPGCAIVDRPMTYAYRQHEGSEVRHLPRSVAGLNMLIDNEHEGRHPGGDRRRRERVMLLTRFVRPLALSTVRCGLFGLSWTLYIRTLRWHLRLRRFRFLSAFPVLAALALVRAPWGGKP